MNGRPFGEDRPVVCVQGLGFVGVAMAVAVASARDGKGNPHFNVMGVELSTPEGLAKVKSLAEGRLPFESKDEKLKVALSEACKKGNFSVTTNPEIYSSASVTIVDVPFEMGYAVDQPVLKLEGFRSAIRTLGESMASGSLVVIESTVAPGTCDKVAAPELADALKKRDLPGDSILLAHSYERVMPGENYLASIVDYWRVYAGQTKRAADACQAFLSKVINVQHYPLTRLSSTKASETAKVLENSYRATTIAFMEEWGRFAEAIGVDLFEVVAAIRQRPTHSNIRQPGFGVGGYCLTKDPLLAELAAREYFGLPDLEFPFCRKAVAVNRLMPLVSLRKIEEVLGGSLSRKRILLLGVSYREGIGDTRFSPSETFVANAEGQGAEVICHDPLLRYWPELKREVDPQIPSPRGIDAIIFAVPHQEYSGLNVKTWLNGSRPVVLDANNVLSVKQRDEFKAAGCRVYSIGRGEER